MTTTDGTASSFEGLRAFLANLPREQSSVRVPFSEIEELIGGSLPAEASSSDWWRFDEGGSITPQSRALMEAGFGLGTIASPPNPSGWVEFIRGVHRYPNVGVTSWEFGQSPAPERLRQLAIAYLESGRLLCKHLGEHPDELTWPRGAVVCFCYRHAVELLLKSCILHREQIEVCDHNISSLRRQYLRLYPGQEFNFRTPYDISLQDIENEIGRGGIDIEGFERNKDQVYRYFSDKQERAPKGEYIFGLGTWLSMLDQLEMDICRIWDLIRASESKV